MGLYNRLFAAVYDRAMAKAEQRWLGDLRHALLAGARGRIFEVGSGTGANVGHYPPLVKDLVLTEPDPHMAKYLRGKLPGSGFDATVLTTPAENIPLESGGFDTAVCFLVLCSVDDQSKALSEIGRVLKPGGRLIFMEHVLSERPLLSKWQNRLDPLWSRISVGCHCNRDTLEAICSSSFAIDSVERSYPPGPPLTRPLVWGQATRK